MWTTIRVAFWRRWEVSLRPKCPVEIRWLQKHPPCYLESPISSSLWLPYWSISSKNRHTTRTYRLNWWCSWLSLYKPSPTSAHNIRSKIENNVPVLMWPKQQDISCCLKWERYIVTIRSLSEIKLSLQSQWQMASSSRYQRCQQVWYNVEWLLSKVA